MSGWTIVRDGSVQVEHLSTSSQMKVTLTDHPDGHDQAPVFREYWLDYSEFYSLMECMKRIEEIITH